MSKSQAVTTRWWWVRHAPVHNPDHRLYGQTDTEADTSDHAAMQALGAALPTGAVWITSHLKRTQQTASAVEPHMTPPPPTPIIEADLAEQNFGAWQGMTFDELKDHLDDGFEAFWRAPGHTTPPGGESFAAVITRVADVVRGLTRTHGGRDIIAFAHGGSIRAALALALDLEANGALSFQIDNLSLTRIDHIETPDGRPQQGTIRPWRITAVNQLPNLAANRAGGAIDGG